MCYNFAADHHNNNILPHKSDPCEQNGVTTPSTSPHLQKYKRGDVTTQ